VIRAWQDGKLGVREQAEHPDGVFGGDDIAITDHDQGRSVDRLDVLRRPTFEIQHPLHALGEKRGQIFGVRSHSEVSPTQFRGHVVQFRVFE
jgi:hypothetical protein